VLGFRSNFLILLQGINKLSPGQSQNNQQRRKDKYLFNQDSALFVTLKIKNISLQLGFEGFFYPGRKEKKGLRGPAEICRLCSSTGFVIFL
jgi:hypothetical protein